jgi:hypothetical protein
MTAQPARIDLADLGPGVAWAFEFDENGRGRLLSGDSSIDLMHGRRFVWVHLILGNVRTREWIGAQDALPPEAREVFYPGIAIRACIGVGKPCGARFTTFATRTKRREWRQPICVSLYGRNFS